jgi:hypothetical protein
MNSRREAKNAGAFALECELKSLLVVRGIPPTEPTSNKNGARIIRYPCNRNGPKLEWRPQREFKKGGW